jgi:hypothetical protein
MKLATWDFHKDFHRSERTRADGGGPRRVLKTKGSAAIFFNYSGVTQPYFFRSLVVRAIAAQEAEKSR